ncbi:MAG: hypothetical protein NTX53_18285, partial [candidate division WOR-3 bacterium]|nr:hypothetical protein [candidate division WOR-3 bacterium]
RTCWTISNPEGATPYHHTTIPNNRFAAFDFSAPTQWRVKPYVWIGVRTAGYTQSSSVYEFHPDAETHWRGGLGVKYRLTDKIDLFAETQLYQQDNWWDGVDYLDGGAWMVGSSMTEVVGLVNAGIGARFALGK